MTRRIAVFLLTVPLLAGLAWWAEWAETETLLLVSATSSGLCILAIAAYRTAPYAPSPRRTRYAVVTKSGRPWAAEVNIPKWFSGWRCTYCARSDCLEEFAFTDKEGYVYSKMLVCPDHGGMAKTAREMMHNSVTRDPKMPITEEERKLYGLEAVEDQDIREAKGDE